MITRERIRQTDTVVRNRDLQESRAAFTIGLHREESTSLGVVVKGVLTDLRYPRGNIVGIPRPEMQTSLEYIDNLVKQPLKKVSWLDARGFNKIQTCSVAMTLTFQKVLRKGWFETCDFLD